MAPKLSSYFSCHYFCPNVIFHPPPPSFTLYYSSALHFKTPSTVGLKTPIVEEQLPFWRVVFSPFLLVKWWGKHKLDLVPPPCHRRCTLSFCLLVNILLMSRVSLRLCSGGKEAQVEFANRRTEREVGWGGGGEEGRTNILAEFRYRIL